MSELSTNGPRYCYEHDPSAIYRQSFATVRAEAALYRLPKQIEPVAIRLIHACGMTDIVDDLMFSEDAVEAGQAALSDGAPILTDVEMVTHGIIRSRLTAGNEVLCRLNDTRVSALAGELATTRSAAAVELWRDTLEGAVVAIGNAPTALFHLLETIADGGPRPALILGFPVGFVGAAESKDALAENPFSLPYLAIKGRRGGSAMAAAAVNALAAGLPEETVHG
ncbi:precorrin-8X methylmutase [Roseibium polysiphoniae]|uniref:Precorrin-8X methylmutase n=1 Tax=Roseibium polysiphoniae TaxID=2571221 RepID=A0ABR9CFQ1_9HYPH|nr:precorrin-8X methylmutase [Roseibium polysiphoniae]